jgi:predicted ester cyclase
MAMQANKERIQRLIDQVWNGGRLDLLPEFFSDQTRSVAEGYHQRLTEAFPDLHINLEDLVAEADRVVVRLTFEGHHRGRFRGIEPTGRAVRFGAIRIYRLADGKVVEMWAEQDALGLVQQLQS